MLKYFSKRVIGLALAGGLSAGAAVAQSVQVEGAWARATVAGQQASGAFMTLSAPQGATLEGVSSPAAAAAELHEMAMQGNVMRMRPVATIALPAGQPVELKPGGLHVMLMGLKTPLVAGSTLPLTLRVRDAKGVQASVELQMPVRALNAPAAAGGHGAHGAHGR